MTRPAGATYGELINQALLEMAEAWQAPIEFPGTGSALLAAQARARLYRSVASTMERFAISPDLGEIDEPITIVHAKVVRLAHRLGASVEAMGSVRDVAHVDQWSGFRATPFGARLARVERLAGAAWDLLSTRLPHGEPPTRGPAAAIRAQHVVADTALLAAGMAGLDPAFGDAITRVTDKLRSDSPIQRVLAETAASCTQTAAAGLAPHAREVANLMAADLDISGWMSLDAIRPTVIATPRRIGTTADALAAIDAYYDRLHQRRDELSVRDLTTLASVAARLAGLVHQTATRLPDGRDAAALAVRLVRAWRHSYYTLRPFASIQPSTVSLQRTAVITTWANRQQHAYVPSRRGSATWNAWVDTAYAIAGRLSSLAAVADNAAVELLRRRRLYLARPGRAYFSWRPAAAADKTVELTGSLHDVRSLSDQLVDRLAPAAPPFSPHHPGRLLRQAFPASPATDLGRPSPGQPAGRVPPNNDTLRPRPRR